MKNFFLTLSGLVFGLVAALHVVRFLTKWTVVIGGVVIPMQVSLWGALAALFLCLGCLFASGRK